MAVTYIDHAGTQGQTDFTFTFPYLEDEHIKVEIDGVDTTDFTVVATPTAKVVLDTGLSVAAAVRVRRRSAPNENLVDFVNGSVLTEAELDLSYRHNRYLAEEIAELNDASLQIENGGTEWDAKTKRIKNVGTAVDSTDAVTKVYLDNKVAQVSTGATQPPLKWVFSAISGTNNTYTVTGAEVLGDTAYEVSIDGLIKEPTVEYTVDPNTDTLTIIPNMTGSEDIVVIQRGFGVAVAGTVGTDSLLDGSVTSDKISKTDTNFNVQSNGNVGIGTENPNHPLVVSGTTQKLYAVIGDSINNSFSSSEVVLRLSGDSLATGAGPGLAFNAGVECAQLFGVRASGGSGGDFFIKTRTYDSSSDTSSLVEYFRIKEDGKVGIGTSIPAHALDVTGDLNITGDYKVNGTNLQTVPTGTVSAFAGSAAPTGYALCDGSAVNRTAQAALFSVIGTTYGIGDGSTTFNLPDLRGRVVAGLGESLLGATADTLGEDNGLIADTKEHLLTAAESGLRDHEHNITPINLASGGFSAADAVTSTKSILSSGTDASSAHNNVQPTIILNYIIKT